MLEESVYSDLIRSLESRSGDKELAPNVEELGEAVEEVLDKETDLVEEKAEEEVGVEEEELHQQEHPSQKVWEVSEANPWVARPSACR